MVHISRIDKIEFKQSQIEVMSGTEAQGEVEWFGKRNNQLEAYSWCGDVSLEYSAKDLSVRKDGCGRFAVKAG